MLWFKFIFGLKYFKPVKFSFNFVSDYHNVHETIKNENQTSLKKFIFKAKINKLFKPQLIHVIICNML